MCRDLAAGHRRIGECRRLAQKVIEASRVHCQTRSRCQRNRGDPQKTPENAVVKGEGKEIKAGVTLENRITNSRRDPIHVLQDNLPIPKTPDSAAQRAGDCGPETQQSEKQPREQQNEVSEPESFGSVTLDAVEN